MITQCFYNCAAGSKLSSAAAIAMNGANARPDSQFDNNRRRVIPVLPGSGDLATNVQIQTVHAEEIPHMTRMINTNVTKQSVEPHLLYSCLCFS